MNCKSVFPILLFCCILLFSGCGRSSPAISEETVKPLAPAAEQTPEETVEEPQSDPASEERTEIIPEIVEEIIQKPADEPVGISADNMSGEYLTVFPEDFVFPVTDGSTSTTNLDNAVRSAVIGGEQKNAHSKTYIAFENLLNGSCSMIFTTPLSEQ